MKVIDLRAWNFNWQAIGNNPFSTSYGGSSNRPFVCIVNGYPSIFYPIQLGNPGISYGAFLVSFDENGSVCVYRTPNFVNGGNNQWQQLQYSNCVQSGNTFTWSMLNSSTGYVWTIPNVFTPGASYTVPYKQLNIPSPCGVGDFYQAIYLGNQNLVAYEFIQAFGLTDNYFASIYNSLGEFVGGGLIGNAANDIFDQTNLVYPPGTSSTDLYCRNQGNFIGDNTTNNYAWLQPTLNGDPGSLTCGVANPSVYVGAKLSQTITPSDLPNVPTSYYGSVDFVCGDTDFPGFFLWPSGPQSMLISSNYCIMLPAMTSDYENLWFSKKLNSWFLHGASGTNQNGGILYKGAGPDLTPYGPPPNVSRSVHNGLANYHRAVSTRGTFQA